MTTAEGTPAAGDGTDRPAADGTAGDSTAGDSTAGDSTAGDSTAVHTAADGRGADAAAPPGVIARARAAVRRDRPARIVMYLVLVVMAFGDGYGIYQTLLSIFLKGSGPVAMFTAALTVGSVAGAHWLGTLARQRREGRDGHPLWTTVVALLWLGLGGVVAWLRITHPLTSSPRDTGATALQVGVLLLALYLLTGALAMTTAYMFGSPRDAELRALLRTLDRAVRDGAEHGFDARRSTALAEHTRARRREADDNHLHGTGLEAFGAYLKVGALHRQAAHAADPVATDAIRPAQ